jgi:uncharacterized protein YndB with AHSA1/START domain
MARAYASTVIEAPVEAVWAVVRDFSALPKWLPGLGACHIEDGLPPDAVGCVRHFTIGDSVVRERLLELDDGRYRFAYNFETPAFPVRNYHAIFELIPVTAGDRTFAQWSATFDEAGGDEGKFEEIISRDVFANGLRSLGDMARGLGAPAGAVRWGGLRPAKVFCASVIPAKLATVWAKVRAFDGMGGWHPDVAEMHMTDGARPDQVSGARDFSINGGHLVERLTWLSDTDHAFRYVIEESPMPWVHYHAGARFYPVTSHDATLGVWTADWVAAPQDDLQLIPAIHQDVFQKAFDTLASTLHSGG